MMEEPVLVIQTFRALTFPMSVARMHERQNATPLHLFTGIPLPLFTLLIWPRETPERSYYMYLNGDLCQA